MPWIVPPVTGLIEPAPAPEIFVDQIGAAELVRTGWVRLYLCTEQLPLDSGDLPQQQVAQAKLVMPLCILPRTICVLGHCLDQERPAVAAAGGPFPRLVR